MDSLIDLADESLHVQKFFNYMHNIGIKCSYKKLEETGRWSEAVPGLKWPEIQETWSRYVGHRKLPHLVPLVSVPA